MYLAEELLLLFFFFSYRKEIRKEAKEKEKIRFNGSNKYKLALGCCPLAVAGGTKSLLRLGFFAGFAAR
ncbi:MAG: hypothetical protein IKU32_05575 [Clostridia bacterium]|nr:hypothetical protein [Clostridia bacterium]